MKVSGVIIQLPCTEESIISRLEEQTGKTASPKDREAALIMSYFLNDAYIDGLDNRPGYPLDPEEEIRAWAEQGVEITRLRRCVATKMTVWRNAAYQEGRRVAEMEVTA